MRHERETEKIDVVNKKNSNKVPIHSLYYVRYGQTMFYILDIHFYMHTPYLSV